MSKNSTNLRQVLECGAPAPLSTPTNPQPLVKCPICGRNGFTKQGLLRHVCKPEKPYGWEIEVFFHDRSSKKYHFTGSEMAVRRKGLTKTSAQCVTLLEPLTKEQWIRAYGDPNQRS